jgi:hypothetical protein
MNSPTTPVANGDALSINTLITTVWQIPVLANDVFTTTPQIVIITQPIRLGRVSAPATPGGTITLTRDIPSFTGRDSFQYMIRDGTALSNLATVTIATTFLGT